LFKYFEKNMLAWKNHMHQRNKKQWYCRAKNTCWTPLARTRDRLSPAQLIFCQTLTQNFILTRRHIMYTNIYIHKCLYEYIIYVRRVHTIASVCQKLFKKLPEKLSFMLSIIIFYCLMDFSFITSNDVQSIRMYIWVDGFSNI